MSNNDFFPITSWANDDKPREKLILKGKHALSDAELLAILLGTGSKNESALDLAKKIVSLCKSDLNELGKLTIYDLCTIKGIGEAKAVTILAALELGLRRKTSAKADITIVDKSKVAFELFHSYLADLPHEEFWYLLLNKRNQVIKLSSLSKGGISGTIVDVKLLIKDATANLASGLIIAHNHPSGNLKPSDADIKLTKKLKSAMDLIDITLQDHLIIIQNNYFSFADNDLM